MGKSTKLSTHYGVKFESNNILVALRVTSQRGKRNEPFAFPVIYQIAFDNKQYFPVSKQRRHVSSLEQIQRTIPISSYTLKPSLQSYILTRKARGLLILKTRSIHPLRSVKLISSASCPFKLNNCLT